MNKFYLFLLTLFASIGVSQSASATVWINIPGDHNEWHDNGVELNSSTSSKTPIGYTVHENIKLGKGALKVKMANDATDPTTVVWYGYHTENGAIPMNQWVDLIGGNDGKNFVIEGASDNSTYDVYWDDNNHRIKVVDAGTPWRLYVIGEWNDWAQDEKYSADYDNILGKGTVNNVPIGTNKFKMLLQPLEIYYTDDKAISIGASTPVPATTDKDAKGTTIKSAQADREYNVTLSVNTTGQGNITPTQSVANNNFIFTIYNADGSVFYTGTFYVGTASGASKTITLYVPFFEKSYYVGINFGYGEKFYGKNDSGDAYKGENSTNYVPLEGSKTPFTVSNAVDGWPITTDFKVARNNANYANSTLSQITLKSYGSKRWSYKFDDMLYEEDLDYNGGTFRYVAHTAGKHLRLSLGAELRTIDPNGGDALISDDMTRVRLVKAAEGESAILTLAEAATYYFNIERINPDNTEDKDPNNSTIWALSVKKRPVIQIEGWSYSVNDAPRQPAIYANKYTPDWEYYTSYGFAGLVKEGDVIKFFYDDIPVSILNESDFVISEAYDGYRPYEYVVDQDGSFIIHKPGAVVGDKVFYIAIDFGLEPVKITVDQIADYNGCYSDDEDNICVNLDRARVYVEDYKEYNWTYIRYTSGIGAPDISYHHNNQPKIPFEREGDEYVISGIKSFVSLADHSSSDSYWFSFQVDGEFCIAANSYNASFDIRHNDPSIPINIVTYDNEEALSPEKAHTTVGVGGNAIYKLRLTRNLFGGWSVVAEAEDYPKVENIRFLTTFDEDGNIVNDSYATPFPLDENGEYTFTAPASCDIRFHLSTILEPNNILLHPDYCFSGILNRNGSTGEFEPASDYNVITNDNRNFSVEDSYFYELKPSAISSYQTDNTPLILSVEKGLTYTIHVREIEDPIYGNYYQVFVYTDGNGGEYPKGWLDTTCERGGAVGFYLSGDINTWCSVHDRNWEYQHTVNNTTGKEGYVGYFCHEENGGFDYRQDDPDHLYLPWPSVKDINRHWRFVPAKPQDKYPGYGQVVDNFTTRSGRNLGSGEWYTLDLAANGASDFHGHAGRLCGQFKIIQGDVYSDNCYATSGGANDAYYNNVIKTGQTNYNTNNKASGLGNGQNLSTQATYIDNAVIYFNSKNGNIVIEGDPVDAYVYYAVIGRDADGNPVTDFSAPKRTKLTTLSQANYFAADEPFENSRKLENLDFSWEEVTNVPYTLTDGTEIILPKAYRKKIASALAHRNPAGYTVTVSRQNGSLFPQQRIDCGDVWFIESETYAYFRYASDPLNKRPGLQAYFNAWTDQFDSNGIITDKKRYQSREFAEMEWIDEVNDIDMPAKYSEYRGMGWFRTKQPIHRDFSIGGYAMFADNYGGFYPAGAPSVGQDIKEEMKLQGVNFFYVVDLSPRVRILYDKLNGTYAVHRDGQIDASEPSYYQPETNEYIYSYLDGEQASNYSRQGSVFRTPYVLQINAEFLHEGTTDIDTSYKQGIQYRFRVYDEKGNLVENSLNGSDIDGKDVSILPDYYGDAQKVVMADTGWIDEPFFSWGLDQAVKDFGGKFDPNLNDTEGMYRVIVVEVRDADGKVHRSQDIYEFYR